MNLMVLPNQLYLIVKLYNNRPELLPDSNDSTTQIVHKKTANLDIFFNANLG